MPLWTIFTKWPGSRRTAVQVAVLGLCRFALGRPALMRRARGAVHAGRDGPKERFETGHHLGLATDHEAEAPLEPEHSAARSHVDVVQAASHQLLGSIDVVAVVGVAAVDDDVARRHAIGQVIDGLAGEGGRHHDPCCSGWGQLGHEVIE